MKKYWFKKSGKYTLPTTWEGSALFVLVIGLVLQVSHIVDGLIPIMIGSGLVAAVGFKLMQIKTDPNDPYNKEKDKATASQIIGTIVGIVLLCGGIFVIGDLYTQYLHKTIGYPVRIENEPVWFEFHGIKNNFVVQLPSYPKYSTQQNPVPNSELVLSSATYDAERENFGEFTINITDLPQEGNYSSPFDLLLSGVDGAKQNFDKQMNEESKATSATTTLLSNPAAEFSFENSKFTFMGVFFLADKKLYALGYITKAGLSSKKDYTRFIQSFRF